MTTAKDLFIIAMDPAHSVGQGDLSLALAGAELIDLVGAGAVVVDGDRIVPGSPRHRTTGSRGPPPTDSSGRRRTSGSRTGSGAGARISRPRTRRPWKRPVS